MIASLQDLIESLGAEMRQARQPFRRSCSGTRIAALQVVMIATVERVGASGILVLCVGSAPRKGDRLHELRIDVPGRAGEMIAVHVDGQLLGHYRQDDDGRPH